MKTTITLLVLLASTFASAAEVTQKYECGVKSLTSSSPKNLRIGDSVRVTLISSEVGIRSQRLSSFQIGGKTIKGFAKLTQSGGAYPSAYMVSSNDQWLLSFEVSASQQNARIRSLSLSSASGGFPVIATLSCVKL